LFGIAAKPGAVIGQVEPDYAHLEERVEGGEGHIE
jgi:hypothetical protein